MKRKNIKLPCGVVILLFCLGLGAAGQVKAIRGAEVHTITGGIIQAGVVLIDGGKIVALGGPEISIPPGAEIIEASGWVLYPGFMAPSCLLTSEEIVTYESFSPDSSALDRLDLYRDYRRYWAGGITSVYLDSPRNRLIPGKGAVIKLAPRGTKSAVVKRDAALRINLNKEAFLPPIVKVYPAPVSTENPITPAQKQFPSSALGAYWVVPSLFDFEPYAGDFARYNQEIADSLKSAQEQQLPLLVQCQRAAEIGQAMELAEALRMPLILSGAAEAHKLAAALKTRNIPVIAEIDLRPNDIYSGGAGIEDSPDFKNIAELLRQEILLALSPSQEKYVPDLLWLALYFRRYGLSDDDLIKTITISPARIFGVEERLGSLGAGKDADILFFRREAGKPWPRLKKIMVEGRIVYEQE